MAMRDFESRDGKMIFAGMNVEDIAKEFGTPVYVTDEQRVRENYRAVYSAFSKYMETEVHYACKANTNLAILSILRQEGAGIDAVSIGEVETCLNALYGLMMLRLQKKEVSAETAHAIGEISTLMGMLSDYYLKDKTEGLNFDE